GTTVDQVLARLRRTLLACLLQQIGPTRPDGLSGLRMEPHSLEGIEARLADVGFAVLRLGTAASAAALAQRLGPVLDVTEVRLGKGRTYLSSADSIPPHTDHPAAKLILWYCQQADGNGAGANLLVDTRGAIRALPAGV